MAAQTRSSSILAVNVGSSSIKVSKYQADVRFHPERFGSAERISQHGTDLIVSATGNRPRREWTLAAADHRAAFLALIEALQHGDEGNGVLAVGHRIVHGGPAYTVPVLITPSVLEDLRDLVPVDPDHLPQALDVIETARDVFPHCPQVACFDTAFHRTMPPVARRYPLPARYARDGIVRYGFHGLSCESIVDELRRLEELPERLVVAHLGSGASLTAIRAGESVETTMGYSPAGGIMMGTRTGDLDPGVLLALLQREGMDAGAINQLVNKDAGLLGVSGRSADMRDLLDHEPDDADAAMAVALYVHRARTALGGLVAVLGGLDALVFTGGIGEHAAPVRDRICAGFGFLGLRLDDRRNRDGSAVVSDDGSAVTVRVMPTDENLVIARHTLDVLPTINEGLTDVPV
jgi:acetate kinase